MLTNTMRKEPNTPQGELGLWATSVQPLTCTKSHFRNGDTEAQRGPGLYPRTHSKPTGRGSRPGLEAPGESLSPTQQMPEAAK